MLKDSARVQDELWQEFLDASNKQRFKDWIRTCWFFKNATKNQITSILDSIIGHDE